jgi:3-dehydroquinate synthetase
MRVAAAIAAGRGAESEVAPRLDDLLSRLGFTLTRAFDTGQVREAMLGDKKRRDGRQRWILPMAFGSVTEVDDITDAELSRALGVVAR